MIFHTTSNILSTSFSTLTDSSLKLNKSVGMKGLSKHLLLLHKNSLFFWQPYSKAFLIIIRKFLLHLSLEHNYLWNDETMPYFFKNIFSNYKTSNYKACLPTITLLIFDILTSLCFFLCIHIFSPPLDMTEGIPWCYQVFWIFHLTQ